MAAVRFAALDRLRENAELRGRRRSDHARSGSFGEYIGVVLLPMACLLPLIAPVTGVALRNYYAAPAWSAGAAIAVFALVNAPAFLTPDIFLHGSAPRSPTP